MTIEDPTLSTLASYDMSTGEAFMGSILLASTILLEMLNSVIPQVSLYSLLNFISGITIIFLTDYNSQFRNCQF